MVERDEGGRAAHETDLPREPRLARLPLFPLFPLEELLMPLDESSQRLTFLLQRDLRRMVEREAARHDRNEEVHYDSVSRVATWETRRRDVIGRWYGESIALYERRDRILRWSWVSEDAGPSRHAELVFKEGLARNVPQLTMSVVAELDEEEAATLARLGALVARADGLHVQYDAERIEFFGLFDSPGPMQTAPPSRYSVPPPRSESPRPPTARKATSSAPPSAPYRSLPPIREIYEPRGRTRGDDRRLDEALADPLAEIPRPPIPPAPETRRADSFLPPPLEEDERPLSDLEQTVEREALALAMADSSRESAPFRAAPAVAIREPARAILMPVASAVIAALAKAHPAYRQGLFVVTVDPDVPFGKRRLVVVLVAIDEAGFLRSLDPAAELVEAAARMVEADAATGNGPWRKLSARITPKVDGGATLHVDVS